MFFTKFLAPALKVNLYIGWHVRVDNTRQLIDNS